MKVLTAGGAMVDTIAIIDSAHIERMTMSNADAGYLLLEEGRKIEAHDISLHVGGGAINAAVSLARQGHDVAALVKLGADQRAETVLQRLTQEGISTRWAMRDQRAPTGSSVMVASHDHNAAIFTFRGANTLIEPGDLKPDAFNVELVYVASLSNESADRFPEIVSRARSAGAMVATNPGVRQLSARGGVLFDILEDIDLLCMNVAEASALMPGLVPRCGDGGPKLAAHANQPVPRLLTRGLEGGGFDMTVARFVCEMRSAGVAHVAITDGTHGAFLASRDTLTWCPALETDVVGTAGAGDAFASTLAAGLAAGADASRALQSAAVNAASVVGHVDTQSGLLDADALEAAVQASRRKLPVQTWTL